MSNGKAKEWLDISNEEYREYTVMSPLGVAGVRIENPVSLSIDEDGHAIKDEDGVTHIIPSWIKITFKEKEYKTSN